MYHIDSKVDVPDIKYLYSEACRMMKRGIKIGNIDALLDQFRSEQSELSDKIRDKYKIINANSAAQIVTFMEGLNDPQVTNISYEVAGKWSSKAEVLERLAEFGYEFARDIVDYRKRKKYADSIESLIKSADANNRIHPVVSLTKTNRVSYSDPAIMNIPKVLLWDCIAPLNKGDVLISADIHTQEPNIMININNVESLRGALSSSDGLYETIFGNMPVKCKVYLLMVPVESQYVANKSELKLHSNINPTVYTDIKPPHDSVFINEQQVAYIETVPLACPIGQKPVLPDEIMVETVDGMRFPVKVSFDNILDEPSIVKKLSKNGIIELTGKIEGLEVRCTPEIRKEFKRAWNAMTYGASELGISNMCKHFKGAELHKYFNSIPELMKYRRDCEARAYKHNSKCYTYFGTELDANETNSSALKRILMDLPIQGTAADILSLLVRHFNDETERMGLKDDLFILYTRHDELIIEASAKIIEEMGVDKVLSIVADLTNHQVDNWEPFKVDVKPVIFSDLTYDFDEV